jgi:hypothetical protein
VSQNGPVPPTPALSIKKEQQTRNNEPGFFLNLEQIDASDSSNDYFFQRECPLVALSTTA